MNKVKISFFVLIFLGLNFAFSQHKNTKNYSLNWNENIEFSISPSNSIKTNVIDGNSLDENLIPVFYDSWNVDNGFEISNYSIKNAVYENIPFSENQFVKNFKFSKDLEQEFKIVKTKGKPKAELKISPYIFEGNTIKRLKSFNLEFTTGNVSKKN